jgi:hypothetical protein
MMKEYGCAAMELNMEVQQHRITIKKNTKIVGVKEITEISPIASINPKPPITKVYLLSQIPIGEESIETEIITVIGAVCNQNVVPEGCKYLGTVGYQGQLVSFYLYDELSGAIDV